MAKAGKDWEFECPQYVDFERQLDSSGKDDIFFDCRDKSSEHGSLCTPEVQGKGKGLTESDENRLLTKMTAALSLLENTPKLKKSTSRSKLFPESASSKTMKANTVPAPHPRTRMSKSLDHLNKIISGKTNKKKCGLRKSSSLNDLRSHHKMKYPITPMCLKRTIFKSKDKILKTSEEMELEQIARLQKQLIRHLRENEISLRKLNLRPRQYAASKILPKSDLKDIKGAIAEKSNAAEKEPRRNIRLLSQAAMKNEASKLDAIIHHKKADNAACHRKSKFHPASAIRTDFQVPNHAAATSKLDTTVHNEAASSRNTRKTKTLSVPSVVSDVISNTAQKTKRPVRKKIMDHSGLMFIPSVRNNTTMSSFIFEEKHKEKPQTAGAKPKEIPALNFKENSDKENKGCARPHFSSRKSQGAQNAKCDMNKFDEPSKIAGKRTNPLKGVPLAENVARN